MGRRRQAVRAAGAFNRRRRRLVILAEPAERAHQLGLADVREGLGAEFVAEELRLAQHALNEVTGVVTSEDLLGEIFSSFCIGK